MTQDIGALLKKVDDWAQASANCTNDKQAVFLRQIAAAIRESQRAGYIVAMRLLQSSEVLDGKETAARDHFLTKANIDAAVKDDWQNAMDRF